MTMWQILVTVIQFQLTHACQGHFGWYNRLRIYVSLVGTYRYVLQWTREKYVNWIADKSVLTAIRITESPGSSPSTPSPGFGNDGHLGRIRCYPITKLCWRDWRCCSLKLSTAASVVRCNLGCGSMFGLHTGCPGPALSDFSDLYF